MSLLSITDEKIDQIQAVVGTALKNIKAILQEPEESGDNDPPVIVDPDPPLPDLPLAMYANIGVNVGPYVDHILKPDWPGKPLQNFGNIRSYWLQEKDLQAGKGFDNSEFLAYIPGESEGWFGMADNATRINNLSLTGAEITVSPEVIYYGERAWNEKYVKPSEWEFKSQMIAWLTAFKESITGAGIVEEGNEPWLNNPLDRAYWLEAFVEVFKGSGKKLCLSALPVLDGLGWNYSLEEFCPHDFRLYFHRVGLHAYALENGQWKADPNFVIDQIKRAQEFISKYMSHAELWMTEWAYPEHMPNKRQHIETILEYFYTSGGKGNMYYQMWRPIEQEEGQFNGCELIRPDRTDTNLFSRIKAARNSQA